MKALVDQAMREGASAYQAGSSTTWVDRRHRRIDRAVRAASRYGGITMTHMRDEEEGMLDALREAIRIGRERGCGSDLAHQRWVIERVGKAPQAIRRHQPRPQGRL